MPPEWTPDEIAALVDGALTGPEAERARLAIETDPEAQVHAGRVRRLNGLLREAYDVPADAPMPAPIAGLLLFADDKVTALPKRRKVGIWVPATVAACLTLAVGLGLYGPFRPSSDRPIATVGEAPPGGALFLALERLPSGETSPEGVRPMLTFRDGTGRPCREFEIDAVPTAALGLGIACRNAAGNWHVEVVVSAPAPGADHEGYVPTSGKAGGELDATVDELGAGKPLTPEEESSLLASDWKGGA